MSSTEHLPTLDELMECEENGEGWCLACGATQCAEPDAQSYECDECGQPMVFGAAELVLMGMVAR